MDSPTRIALRDLGRAVVNVVDAVSALQDRAPATEPTWTSNDGVTTRLRDLPTPYLKHVQGLASRMIRPGHGGGLYDAIDDELDARKDRESA